MSNVPIGDSYFNTGFVQPNGTNAGVQVDKTFTNIENLLASYDGQLNTAITSLSSYVPPPLTGLDNLDTNITVDVSSLTATNNSLITIVNSLNSLATDLQNINTDIGDGSELIGIEDKITILMVKIDAIGEIDSIAKNFTNYVSVTNTLLNGGSLNDLQTIEAGLLTEAERILETKYQQDLYKLQTNEFTKGYILPDGFHIKELKELNKDIAETKRVSHLQIEEQLTKIIQENRKTGITAVNIYSENNRAKIIAQIENLKNQAQLLEYLASVIEKKYTIKSTIKEMQIKVYQSVAQVYNTTSQAFSGIINGLVTIKDSELRAKIASLQAQLEVVKSQLTLSLKQADLKLAGSTSAAKFLSTLVAGAINALNASASISNTFKGQVSLQDAIETIRSNSYSESVHLS